MSSRKHLGKRIEDLGKQIDVALAWLDLDIPADPVEFFKTVLHIEPYPYQVDFLQDPSPLKVLRWCRRAGKTTVMSGSDIHFAAFHPGAVIIITMPKFGQIKEIYFQGEAGLHAHLARMDDKVYDVLIEEELQTIIRFRNKAMIIPETPEPFTIRGHGLS